MDVVKSDPPTIDQQNLITDDDRIVKCDVTVDEIQSQPVSRFEGRSVTSEAHVMTM